MTDFFTYTCSEAILPLEGCERLLVSAVPASRVMPSIHKYCLGLYLGFILTLLFLVTAPSFAIADEDIPSGFKSERYQEIWERNPFVLPVAAAVQKGPTAFDKLVLVSWLKEGPKTIAFIQNTDTSEVQKVTTEPNQNKLKLIEIHKDMDPNKADVVLSNGAEEGAVKFRMDVPASAAQAPASQPPPAGTITNNQVTTQVAAPNAAPVPGGMTHQTQPQQNALQQQQGAGVRAAQTPPGIAPVASPANSGLQPRHAGTGRRRMIPQPPSERPTAPGTTLNQPVPQE